MTHETTLFRPNIVPRPATRPATARVAVVMRPADVPSTLESATDGHAFVFRHVRQFFERGFRDALAGVAAEIAVFADAPPTSFDAYIYAEADLAVSGILGHTCTADSALTVQNARGEILLARAVRKEGSFVAMPNGPEVCLQALGEAAIETSTLAADTIARLP